MKTLCAALLVTITASSLAAATPAQSRLAAAQELQSRFDASQIRGWELKFVVRGERCDVLHVEGYTNLTDGMVQALANGTLMYGSILPGGVNQFAFGRGFHAVAYTNSDDPEFAYFGTPARTRKQVRQLRRCTDSIAAKLSGAEAAVKAPKPPRFEPLSWTNAHVGTKLYDGAYKHEATIVGIDRGEGLIRVKYVRSGTIEPKLLEAVSRFWYVRF